jgi:sulfopropanediol 3-dehydrogenase
VAKIKKENKMKIVTYDEIDTVLKSQRTAIDVDWAVIRQILEEVRQKGDTAIKAYTLKFDGVSLDSFKIEKHSLKEAYYQLDTENVTALENAASRLRIFAEKQLEQLQDFEFEIAPGVRAGQRVIPIERVGVYVPGGNFPLVSSLLMGAVPARAAGVTEIAVCTPPGPDGNIHPAVLAAAYIADIDELYTIGGIQAIGALAYGTESIKAVDKIVGPGNKYVTAAKKEVYGDVGIDFIAGPSEVLIIADKSAEPAWIAADLLAQAEHDIMAVPLLVTSSKELAQQVNEEIDCQLSQLDTREIARQSLEKNGCTILVETLEQAVEFSNIKAPEHLELQVEDPEPYILKLRNYGTLFIGNYAAEVLGDYSSGLNHTLPTGRATRYTGGLSVRDFVKIQTTLRADKKGMSLIGKDALQIARMEGLSAHANTVSLRINRL